MELLGDYTLRIVALGSGVLGATAGGLGSFAVLRRQSLLGDAVSHAALPGIALAFLLTGSKIPVVMMGGAALAGWLATLAVRTVTARSRVPFDTALGMTLAVFFGFGLVLLTFIQKQPNAAQAGLENFLFGQAAALLLQDVVAMAVVGAIALVALALLWKELKLLAFDRGFGVGLGLPMARLDGLLTALLVVAIVIGLQTVGVVLMSAMIVAPAAAARQWSRRLGPMVALAAAIGALCGAAGAVASSLVPRLPTGPTIVLLLSGVVAVSLLAAPGRGLVWRWLGLGRLRRAPQLDPVLIHLYALSLQHAEDPGHGHTVAVLRTMSPRDADVGGALEGLESRGLAQQAAGGLWAPTELGRREARRTLEREGGEGL
ncbi:MAG: ABC transporter [Holophagae bacterium]|nr:MAG: ABC transporter [Holophagae bacterium]